MLSAIRQLLCGPNAAERVPLVGQFKAKQTPQSDAGFLAACHVSTDEHDRFIALKTRIAIANFGELPSEYILASHRLAEDLQWHPHWESLDQVELVMLLEDQLDVRIHDDEYERLPNLSYQNVPVPEFIQAVNALVKPKLNGS